MADNGSIMADNVSFVDEEQQRLLRVSIVAEERWPLLRVSIVAEEQRTLLLPVFLTGRGGGGGQIRILVVF